MLIRITKELCDLPKHKRPARGKVYESTEIISGKYNAQENRRRIIQVNGHEVSVSVEEYEPLHKRKKEETGTCRN